MPSLARTTDDPAVRLIERTGWSDAARDDFTAFDAAFFTHVRQILRGEVPRRLLAELDLGLELTEFHALTAIHRIGLGLGRGRAEPATVGLLAEEMAIDPSRASRLATALIARGFLVRGAAQDDGRKSVLIPTAQAEAAFAAFREARWAHMLAHFEGWTEEEVATFTRLFERFVAARQDG